MYLSLFPKRDHKIPKMTLTGPICFSKPIAVARGVGMMLNTQGGTTCPSPGRSGGGKPHTKCEWWAGGSPVENLGLLSEGRAKEEGLAEITEAHHPSPGPPVQRWGVAVQRTVLSPKKSHLCLWSYPQGMHSVITYASSHLQAPSLGLLELCRNSPQISPKRSTILWGLEAHSASRNHPIPSLSWEACTYCSITSNDNEHFCNLSFYCKMIEDQ